MKGFVQRRTRLMNAWFIYFSFLFSILFPLFHVPSGLELYPDEELDGVAFVFHIEVTSSFESIQLRACIQMRKLRVWLSCFIEVRRSLEFVQLRACWFIYLRSSSSLWLQVLASQL